MYYLVNVLNHLNITFSLFTIFIIENILNIKVKDKNNRQLSSKTIELKGASSNNFDDAKINLIQKLKKYEEQNSILPFE